MLIREILIRRQPFTSLSNISAALVVVGSLVAGSVIDQVCEPTPTAAVTTARETQPAVLQVFHDRAATLGLSRQLLADARSIGVSVPELRSMWQQVAICEVGGRWSMVGPSYSGIGFANSTWLTFGGSTFASAAGRATRDQQIVIAMRVTGGWIPDRYGCTSW
ncbi:MAG: transglycosylase family protein [Acidimicrobiales bacterium]